MQKMIYPTLEDSIGNTPLVILQRVAAEHCKPKGNVILGKLEGHNPAGSVKDRPALSMIKRAEERGEIKPGDTLIEATSGNTGIALAMAAAIKGYRMILIMPEDLSIERAQTMKAFGAELILTPKVVAWNTHATWPTTWLRRAKVASWISFPTQTIHAVITKPPGPTFGPKQKAKSHTLSVPWAPRAPSQACRSF